MKSILFILGLFAIIFVLGIAGFFTWQAMNRLDIVGSGGQPTISKSASEEKIGPYTVSGSIVCKTCSQLTCVNQVDLLVYISPLVEGNQKEKVIAGPIFVNGEPLLSEPHEVNFEIENVHLNNPNLDYKAWIIGVLKSKTDKKCSYQVKVGSANFSFPSSPDSLDVGVIELKQP